MAVMYVLQMRSLTDSNPRTFQNQWIDVDNILSVFLQRVLFLTTAKRYQKAVINVDVVTRYYRVVICCQNEIHINKFAYLLTYLRVQRNIQTWTNCRYNIAYCYGLWTWIFDQTQWTDADQSLTIRSLLLTGRHWHGNSSAGHPCISPAPLPLPLSILTGKMLSGQSIKTNKTASDATTEAPVVMIFACVEWRGIALSPTGHLFGNFQAASVK